MKPFCTLLVALGVIISVCILTLPDRSVVEAIDNPGTQVIDQVPDDWIEPYSPVTAMITASDVELEAPAQESGLSAWHASERPDQQEIWVRKFDPVLTDDSTIDDLLRNRLWLEIDRLNCPLVQSLGLAPLEAARLRELFAENLIAAANRAVARLDEGHAAFEQTLDAVLETERPRLQQQIFQLLGEPRSAAFSASVRDVSQFNRLKFLNPVEPLPDRQTFDVLAAISSETELVTLAAAELLLEDGLLSGENLPELPAQWESELQLLTNARVYERLKLLLSPDRLAAFAEFQSYPW
jgi:hypothetical protein